MPVQRTTLNVPLIPELERFITACVKSGHYQTKSEVVRAALRLLKQNEARPPVPVATAYTSSRPAGAE